MGKERFVGMPEDKIDKLTLRKDNSEEQIQNICKYFAPSLSQRLSPRLFLSHVLSSANIFNTT